MKRYFKGNTSARRRRISKLHRKISGKSTKLFLGRLVKSHFKRWRSK